jgi:hypothetical protein
MMSPKSESAGERRSAWLLLLAAVGMSVWLVSHTKRRASALPRVDLLRVVPSGPELLVTADLASLDAPTVGSLLRAGGDALLGLQGQCGFEPLLAVKRIALAVPFRANLEPKLADFALVAETSLDQEAMLRCAESVIQKRGGKSVRSQLGRFTSLRDQAKPEGEVAIRDDGLFVLSGGQYFRDVIDAAGGTLSGDQPARLRSALHLAMRRKLAPSQLLVTLVPATSPVPGVQALGLGVEVKRELELRGFVGCRSEAACSQARELALSVKSELMRDPRVSGFSTVSIVQHQQQLIIDGHLPREQLPELFAQLLAL